MSGLALAIGLYKIKTAPLCKQTFKTNETMTVLHLFIFFLYLVGSFVKVWFYSTTNQADDLVELQYLIIMYVSDVFLSTFSQIILIYLFCKYSTPYAVHILGFGFENETY